MYGLTSSSILSMRASVVKVRSSVSQTPDGLSGASFFGFNGKCAQRPRHIHVRARGKYCGATRTDDRLSLALPEAGSAARRIVLSVNSAGSMLPR